MTFSDRTPVAVVGAGIAGATLGAALTRRGVPCELHERAPVFEPVGAGIQLAPDATRVLERLGLGPTLRTASGAPEALVMRRWDDGRVLRRTPLGAACEQRFGAPYLTLHRADLHAALVELLPDGVLHRGRTLIGATEDPDGVDLHLEGPDGALTARASVLVGADGIHSRVREHLVQDRPRYSGHAVYRAVVPAERVPAVVAAPAVTIWLGPDKHCVAYPISGGAAVSVAATVPDPAGPTGESWTAPGRVADLASHYTGWHEEVRALVSAPESVGRWALHDRDPITTWGTARTTILGDAAHPMLPFFAQGANQAVEDAAALATRLARAGELGVPAALRDFAVARHERTAQVHEVSRRNTVLLHLPDGEEQRHRDEILAAGGSLADQAWLWGHDAEQVPGDAAPPTLDGPQPAEEVA